MTWLDGKRYYSITTRRALARKRSFARTGAGDPNFNLIAEPLMILRREATDQTFASVIEPHGYFSELEERSRMRAVWFGTFACCRQRRRRVSSRSWRQRLRWVVMVNNGPRPRLARIVSWLAGRR
jgi:hypothetical protein